MLNRQKALLELVRLAGGCIDRMVLTKWAFLVRHETESRGGESFYDFVPYRFGPFSFALYQDVGKLVESGHLRETTRQTWSLGDVAATFADRSVQTDLTSVADRFRTVTTDDLVEYVYHSHPHYTINSELKQLAERPVAVRGVFTAGYEGKSIDRFLDGLIRAGVRHLIDVRRNPIARRYGFHRSTLARLSERLDIGYTHVPELGIASAERRQLVTAEDYATLFRRYESTTLKTERLAIDEISALAADRPSVVVCMEADPACCHRARLAVSVGRATGLPVIHLG
jgi:uncharacterized protein (DUF488 family)